MQLGAYKYLISMTENDEVNTLSCIQYAEVLGSENVFRLPPASFNSAQADQLKKLESGRLITSQDINFNVLRSLTSDSNLK